jgi:hypothetical protein
MTDSILSKLLRGTSISLLIVQPSSRIAAEITTGAIEALPQADETCWVVAPVAGT